MLCMAVLLVTNHQPFYRWFTFGPPLLTAGPTVVETGARLGSFDLTGGQHYLVQMQGEVAQTFQVAFAYPDGTRSDLMTVDRHGFSGSRPFQAVIKPHRDIPGATLEFLQGDQPLPKGILLKQVSVQQLKRTFYVWAKIVGSVRWAAALGLVAAILRLIWLASQRWSARERCCATAPGVILMTTSRHRAALVFWAMLLLLTGGLMEPFFIQQKVSGLFDKQFPHPAIKGWDDSFYYFWLRSVMVDGDVDFSNDLLYCSASDRFTRERIVREAPRTATGLLPNKYPIGWALVGLPWYLAADVTAHVVNRGGAHIPYDGWHPIYQLALVLGQMAYAVAGLYFAYRFVAEYLPGTLALCGVLSAWLGSALFYYQTLGVTMAHNTMFFAVAGAYWFALRLRRHPASVWNWALVGLLCALVILSRYQGVTLLLFPGVVCLRLLAADFRRTVPRFLLATVAGALPLGLQVLAWKLVFGSFLLYTYQGETFSWTQPHVLESLFSPFHGLLYWHPAVLAALVGFGVWAVRTKRRVDALCFAGSLGAGLYVDAAWDCWWFGASFGARAFDGGMLFAMLGLAALLSELLRWRVAAVHVAMGALFALGLWNLELVLMADKSLLAFERPVSWSEMAKVSVQYWSGH